MEVDNNINHEERVAIMAVNAIFAFDPMLGKHLIEEKGSAYALFNLSKEERLHLGVGDNKYDKLLSLNNLDNYNKEIENITKQGAYFLTIKDEDYPTMLKECPDAPLGLYVKTTTPISKLFSPMRPYIAIVGTRDISAYGAMVCTKIIDALSGSTCQPTIVSGLAMGVDITSHTQALQKGLPTIAVMATGIDSIYPSFHSVVAQQIANNPYSALITDYPLGTLPLPINFLKRNRIMAGISIATILIESKIRGGGLMTARLASSYNREVYAVPGRINDVKSQGCNKLIKDNIAQALVDVNTLLKDLGFATSGSKKKINMLNILKDKYLDIVEEEDLKTIIEIVKLITARVEVNKQDLLDYLHLDYRKLIYLTGLLETDGFISIDLLHNYTINKNFM